MLEHEMIDGLGYKVGPTIYANDPRDRSEWNDENRASFLAEMQAEYDAEQARLNPPLSLIDVTNVDGALRTPSDFAQVEEIKITCAVGDVVSVKGQLAIDDEDFVMPVMSSSGALSYHAANVLAEAFSVDLQFTESGKYQISADLLNQELSVPRFDMKPISVYVVNTLQNTAA